MGLLVLFGSCAEKPIQKTKTPGLYTVFYKIGKADAALVSEVSEDGLTVNMLIDAGEENDAEELIDKLHAEGVEALDVLVVTHFDKDHIGGVPALLSAVPVKTIYMPDYTGSGAAYDAFMAALAVYEGDQIVLAADSVIDFGKSTDSMESIDSVESTDSVESEVWISTPKASVYDKKQDNNSSLAVFVTYGNHTLLFAGDAERARQEELLSEGLSHVSLLKVPHHGVWNKGLDDFFAACTPDYAVITCSDKNPAESKTTESLASIGSKIFETRNGDIHVRVDAEGITVLQ